MDLTPRLFATALCCARDVVGILGAIAGEAAGGGAALLPGTVAAIRQARSNCRRRRRCNSGCRAERLPIARRRPTRRDQRRQVRSRPGAWGSPAVRPGHDYNTGHPSSRLQRAPPITSP